METKDCIPSATELEEAVVAACLIESTALPEIVNFIRPEMFYSGNYRETYEAMLALYTRGNNVDMLTTIEELKSRGTLEQVGGPYFIAQTAGRLASAAHLAEHAEVVRQYYLRRELTLGFAQLQAAALDMTTDLYDTLLNAQRLLDRLLEDSPRQANLKAMPAVMEVTMQAAEERVMQTVDGVTGITTGLRDLDEMTGGLQPGETIVIAGRPGEGKTAFALFMALNAAKTGKNVLYFSLEMSAGQLGDRWMLSSCDINPYAWKHGKLSAEDLEVSRETAGRLRSLPIHVDDTGSINIDEICSTAKSLRAKKLCDVVFVDYLQLCNAGSQHRNREQEVSECSRKAKALARQLSCPVVILSQLNRELENRPGQVPHLSDLRESGAIEQDADIVMLLYRPAKAGLPTDKVSGYPTDGLGVGIVAKHRNGETGRVYFGHNPSMTKIGDYVPTEEWIRRNVKGR